MKKKNKNERKKAFMESLKIKKAKSTKIIDESVSDLMINKKEDKKREELEAPSVIIERSLRKEIAGRLGKKDKEEETR